MSRKSLFLYTLLGLFGFVGCLVLVAPPLAIVPFGFSAIYLPVLFLSLLLSWAIPSGASVVRWLTVALVVGIFVAMGSIIAAIVGALLTTTVYTVHRRTNRPTPRVTAETADFPSVTYAYGGMRYNYSTPVETAARMTP